MAHHNRFTALFRDHLGEPVPEENFWTLCRVSNTPGNPGNLLEIYKVSWKFSGFICEFVVDISFVTILVFQSVSVQNISR